MNIDGLIEKIAQTVETHRLEEGVYARWLWQDKKGERVLGKNEYGCADAANILYTIGRFPQEPQRRAKFVAALQSLQDPQTGLYREATHVIFHTTAHCIAALELFDAKPLYPITAMEPYKDPARACKMLDDLLAAGYLGPYAHTAAGLVAAMTITRMVDLKWKDAVYATFERQYDPTLGMAHCERARTSCDDMTAWFHHLLNFENERRAYPHAEALIDACIEMYRNRETQMWKNFAHDVRFMEMDWIFCMNRASWQTPHRFEEVQELLWAFAQEFIAYLDQVDIQTDEQWNDLHMLFGVTCALSELQLALPGKIESTVPLKSVLDRRPFI